MGGTNPQVTLPGGGTFTPAAGRMRRLTRSQYRNAIADAFGTAALVRTDLPDDESLQLFSSIGASLVTTSDSAVELYSSAAEDIASQVVAQRQTFPQLASCLPTSASDACVRDAVQYFGSLLWRRPLTEQEVAWHVEIVQTAQDAGHLELGLLHALSALLQAPYFLYVPAVGEVLPGSAARRFSGSEMATRLGLLLLDSGPDASLRQAATDGSLATPEGTASQARRLLATDRGRYFASRFFSEYWGLTRIVDKDTAGYPSWSKDLETSLREEFTRTVADIVARGVDFREMFSLRETFMDARVASLYGVPAQGSGFVKLALPTERVGLFTSGAFMAAMGSISNTSPVRRGKLIKERLLCETVPAPPPGIDTSLVSQPDASRFPTNRSRLEEHTKSPACAGCHALFDPLGMALEGFDTIGQFRTQMNGATIDTSVDFQGVHFSDARDVASYLARDQRVADCMAQHLYAYAVGDEPAETEQPAIANLKAALASSGNRIDELVVALVSSEAFRYFTPDDAAVAAGGQQ